MFRKHKHRRNPYIEKQKRSGKPVQIRIKLQPSLRIHWVGLLKFTNSQFEGERNIKFTYADMDGALKAMLNTPVRNKSILEFKTKLGNGNLEFNWWSWRGCLRGYLWTVNILFYLLYSSFAICLLQASWFCFWWFLAGWHRSLMFLMNHTTYFMDLLLPVRKHNKKGPTYDLSVHMKQNSTEWATICCSISISIFAAVLWTE